MKEDKELRNDLKIGNECSDLEDPGNRTVISLKFSKERENSTPSSKDESTDSDDSGFIGKSRCSLNQLDGAKVTGGNAPETTEEHDRNYYLDLIIQNEIFRKFQIPVTLDRMQDGPADVSGEISNVEVKEQLTEDEGQARATEYLQELYGILPDTLVNLMAGYFRDGDSGIPISKRPDWLDMEKFLRGQKFAQDHLFGVFYSNMLSLFALYSFEDGLKPLIITDKSSTPYTSFKRYLSTGNRIRNWYTEDPWAEGTAARRDIQVVRQIHKNIRSSLESASNEEIDSAAKIENPWCPYHDLLRADFQSTCPVPAVGQCPYVKYRGNPLKPKGLNQGDMASTQFGFVGLMILFPKSFGAHYATDEDLEAFCHVWRSIGYLLGIDDEFNFCRGTLEDVRQRSRDFLEFWVKPNLREITPEWEHMMRCLFEGLTYYFPGSTYETALFYLAELLNLEMPRLYASLSYKEWMRHQLTKVLLLYTIRLPGVKTHLNNVLNASIDKALKFSPEKNAELQRITYPFQKGEQSEPETANDAML